VPFSFYLFFADFFLALIGPEHEAHFCIIRKLLLVQGLAEFSTDLPQIGP